MKSFFTLVILSITLMSVSHQNIFAQEITKEATKETTSKISNLTVFSESNIIYSLVKIARLYSKTNNSIVSIIFNNSAELIKNISDGEPDDIFISSHPEWSKILKQKGLVDVYNITNVAQDKLVLISSNKNKKNDILKISQSASLKEILANINQIQSPIIIDSPNTSLGKYTQAALEGIDIYHYKIYTKANEDKKSIVSFVNDNDEYFGITFLSAIKNYRNVVVLKIIDDIDIYYQAFVIAGNNMEKARDFSKFLNSEPVQNLLIEDGFIIK